MLLEQAPVDNRPILARAQATGAWLSVVTTPENGTDLSAEKFWDALHPQVWLDPAGPAHPLRWLLLEVHAHCLYGKH